MLSIKPGVRVRGLSNEILLAVIIANEVYAKYDANLTLTSFTDGDHKTGSLHHCGDAVDLRLPVVGLRAAIIESLRTALTADYDVVLEIDHIHVEYDPK